MRFRFDSFATQLRSGVFTADRIITLPDKSGAIALDVDILSRQTFSNANVTVSATTTQLAQTGTLTAARTVTLPLANSKASGFRIDIVGESGTSSPTNKIILARSGSDLINGLTTLDAITFPNGAVYCVSDGVSRWSVFFSRNNALVSAPTAGWVRPADWLAMPVVGAGEQKFVGLFAVTPDDSNYLALMFQGAYTVDWGDGTSANVASGVRAEKLYTYSSISAATDSTRGYRQVLVTVTPQSGQNLTSINLQQRHSRFASGFRSVGWLDITLNGSNFNSLTIGGVIFALMTLLERINIQTIGTLTSVSGLFRECRAIQSFTVFNTASVTDFSAMYLNCTNSQVFPLIDTAAGINFTNMYNGCSGAQTFPLINTASGTSFASMYINCIAAQTFPLINTASGTNFASMYFNNVNAQTFPAINTAAGTAFAQMYLSCEAAQTFPLINTALGTSFANIYGSCISGASVGITGSRFAISFANMKLSRQAIASIFTGLGTALGTQTVTVTGNHGVPDLTAADLLIATNKGWTVAT